MNSSPKISPPIGEDGLFVKVWSIWFDRLKAAIDATGLFIKNQVQVKTTDATITTVQSLPLEAQTTYNVKMRLIGTNSTDRAGYIKICTAYRLAAGAVIQSITDIHTSESVAAWDGTFTVSGNNLQVSATGFAATNITWGSFLEWTKVKNG